MSPFPEVASINEMIHTMRATIQEEIKENPDFQEEGDFILAAMLNLEEELKGVKDIDALELKKKVRVLAFLTLIENSIEEMMCEDFMDDDFEDFDDEDDEDFLLDFEDEDEKPQIGKMKK